MRHEAWSDGSFFPIINRDAAGRVEADARLVWTTEASSWTEAMTRYHEWRGWSPYRPIDDDSGVYTSAEELAAAALLARDPEAN
ncbi:MAG TPA: hypothetical protein PLV92_23610 [Pirellulaceae bacterium]|nr:hypothetical protein [Pirellulaceae bacterium]